MIFVNSADYIGKGGMMWCFLATCSSFFISWANIGKLTAGQGILIYDGSLGRLIHC